MLLARQRPLLLRHYVPHLKLMRIMPLALGVLLGALLAPLAHAGGDGPPRFEDRPRVGQPVRFTDAAGHVFRPDRLVVSSPDAVRAAPIPTTINGARSEEHVDLSGLPLIGHLFRERVAPGDARRGGIRVGPLTRLGSALVLDAREPPVAVEAREIVLTANFPRDGAVSYPLGRLAFAPAQVPSGTGRPAGTAWLIGDVLVLTGPGREPAIDGLEGILEGLVR